MATVRVQIVQGDTWEFVVGWYEPFPSGAFDPGSPIDISGWTAKCQVRAVVGATPALTLTSSPAAGLIVDGPAGTVTGRASPAQTTSLAPGNWLWEVEITNGTDTRTLNPSSKLIVKPQVTT